MSASSESSTGKAPPASRRERSETRRRAHVMAGRFDDREAALFGEAYERYRHSPASAEHGRSESAFLRWSTIGQGARKLPPRRINPDLPPDLVTMLGRVMTELMRQGNNLNQIAHHQNAGREVLPDYVQATFAEYRETMRAARTLMGWED